MFPPWIIDETAATLRPRPPHRRVVVVLPTGSVTAELGGRSSVSMDSRRTGGIRRTDEEEP